MELYFVGGWDKKRHLGHVDSFKECFEMVQKFISDHSYKSYYTRCHLADNVLVIDVGSWSQFFHLEQVKQSEWNEYSKIVPST